MKARLLILGCASALLLCACGPRRTSADAEESIRNNLQQYYLGGRQYLLETGKPEARFADLVGTDKYLLSIRPANGESYEALVVTANTKTLTVKAADGREVTFASE